MIDAKNILHVRTGVEFVGGGKGTPSKVLLVKRRQNYPLLFHKLLFLNKKIILNKIFKLILKRIIPV